MLVTFSILWKYVDVELNIYAQVSNKTIYSHKEWIASANFIPIIKNREKIGHFNVFIETSIYQLISYSKPKASKTLINDFIIDTCKDFYNKSVPTIQGVMQYQSRE